MTARRIRRAVCIGLSPRVTVAIPNHPVAGSSLSVRGVLNGTIACAERASAAAASVPTGREVRVAQPPRTGSRKPVYRARLLPPAAHPLRIHGITSHRSRSAGRDHPLPAVSWTPKHKQIGVLSPNTPNSPRPKSMSWLERSRKRVLKQLLTSSGTAQRGGRLLQPSRSPVYGPLRLSKGDPQGHFPQEKAPPNR